MFHDDVVKHAVEQATASLRAELATCKHSLQVSTSELVAARAECERLRKLASDAIGGNVTEFDLLHASERAANSQIHELERLLSNRDKELRERDAALARAEAAEHELRELACRLSVGGYNDPKINPVEFAIKICHGIDDAVRVPTRRAEAAEAELDAARAECDRLQSIATMSHTACNAALARAEAAEAILQGEYESHHTTAREAEAAEAELKRVTTELVAARAARDGWQRDYEQMREEVERLKMDVGNYQGCCDTCDTPCKDMLTDTRCAACESIHYRRQRDSLAARLAEAERSSEYFREESTYFAKRTEGAEQRLSEVVAVMRRLVDWRDDMNATSSLEEIINAARIALRNAQTPAQEQPMSPRKQLVYRFMELPHVNQLEIANRLGVEYDGMVQHDMQVAVLKAASDGHLLGTFWEWLNEFDGNNETNPFSQVAQEQPMSESKHFAEAIDGSIPEPETGGEKAGDVRSAPSVEAKATPSPLPASDAENLTERVKQYAELVRDPSKQRSRWWNALSKANKAPAIAALVGVERPHADHLRACIMELARKVFPTPLDTPLTEPAVATPPTPDPDRGKVAWQTFYEGTSFQWERLSPTTRAPWNRAYDAVIAHREGRKSPSQPND